MTIEELQVIFDSYPPETEVKLFGHHEISEVHESSHLIDPENDTDRNYLVLLPPEDAR